MNIENNSKDDFTFDAIVIGSGISGGYAAMELCNKGYNTIVLERGRMVKHGEYPTADLDSWELPHHNRVTAEEKAQHYFNVMEGLRSYSSNIDSKTI